MSRQNTHDLLRSLEDVTWSPLEETSRLLALAGYQSGFYGKDHAKLEQLRSEHVTQVHGKAIVEASEETAFTTGKRPEADGIFTLTNRLIAVKTADCLPILFASNQTTFAMAVHAGWRGLTAGILDTALTIASKCNIDLTSIKVAIGPAISLGAFEVGREVVDALKSENSGISDIGWPIAIAKGARDRWHVDLQVAAASHLILHGITPTNIEVIRSCTRDAIASEDPTRKAWHSYRRDGKKCGSNWSWIQRK